MPFFIRICVFLAVMDAVATAGAEAILCADRFNPADNTDLIEHGLMHAFGQPEDGDPHLDRHISLPKSFVSINLARWMVFILANLHRSVPGQATILTISSCSEPMGVPFLSKAFPVS